MSSSRANKGAFKMMKTCKLCGLRYQTMAEDGPKYCHKCTLSTFKSIFTSIKPILFEYSAEQLEAFNTTCKYFSALINEEMTRRASYFANMMEQRKPR